MKKTCNIAIIATDFSKIDKDLEQWILKREKKEKIYIAIEDYILFLKNSLENEDRLVERIEIEQELKQLEKEKQKYYLPSILSESRLSPIDEITDIKQKESPFKLLKKINNYFKK